MCIRDRPRPVRAAAEEEEKEAEQVQPLPPLQRHAGMGAQELYQVCLLYTSDESLESSD